MKKLVISIIYLVFLSVIVSGCSNEVVQPTKVVKGAFWPDAKIVRASSLSTQSLSEAENDLEVMVAHERTFSNGETIRYIVYDGMVIDGDIVLGTKQEFEQSLDKLQATLDNKDGINTQGAFSTSYCEISTWFGCLFWSAGGRWPGGKVYYEPIPNTFNVNEKRNILDAIAEFDTRTNLTFIESSTAPNRIYFQKHSNVCNSRLGMMTGRQHINLTSGCAQKNSSPTWHNRKGYIIHEIGHAIGMIHEHQRPDRDTYISLNHSNFKGQEWWKPWFLRGMIHSDIVYKYSHNRIHYYSESDYDYGSIMHYPNRARSYGGSSYLFYNVNGSVFTKLKPYSGTIGQREGLSSGDIDTIFWQYHGY